MRLIYPLWDLWSPYLGKATATARAAPPIATKCVQYSCVSKQCYGSKGLGFWTCVQMLLHWLSTEAKLTLQINTAAALEVDSGGKNPRNIGGSWTSVSPLSGTSFSVWAELHPYPLIFSNTQKLPSSLQCKQDRDFSLTLTHITPHSTTSPRGPLRFVLESKHTPAVSGLTLCKQCSSCPWGSCTNGQMSKDRWCNPVSATENNKKGQVQFKHFWKTECSTLNDRGKPVHRQKLTRLTDRRHGCSNLGRNGKTDDGLNICSHTHTHRQWKPLKSNL